MPRTLPECLPDITDLSHYLISIILSYGEIIKVWHIRASGRTETKYDDYTLISAQRDNAASSPDTTVGNTAINIVRKRQDLVR